MNAELWTAFEAAAATGGALCARGGDPDRWVAEEWAAGGLSIDTRTLAPGGDRGLTGRGCDGTTECSAREDGHRRRQRPA